MKKKNLIMVVLSLFILLNVAVVIFISKNNDTKHDRFVNKLSKAIDKVGSISEYEKDSGVTKLKEESAQYFIGNNLSQEIGIKKICTIKNMKACGIDFSIPIKTLSSDGTTITLPESTFAFGWNNTQYGATNDEKNSLADTNVAGFVTKDGVSAVVYYNPYCGNNELDNPRQNGSWGWRYTANKMCVNFVYDLNGVKKPNTVGQDIGFATVFYRDNLRLVSPKPDTKTAKLEDNEKLTFDEAVKACGIDGKHRLPSIEEAMAIYINKIFIDNAIGGAYWSNSAYTGASGVMWRQDLSDGTSGQGSRGHKRYARCVKK